ncbi:uncharacterized protein C20orf85 homolog [Lacerta agilis]|uniref:uncharacterized protein C20orf85 homolog n=1 Tax=Lacerta agilis TaxID=80427 RepID=UPI0014196E5C|nr:uncharacterized protein C20orf85 homolog [Lacerta agilis]
MTQKSKLNFVAENQIWKDHVETENIAARRWPERWGFLLTPVEELLKDEKKPPAKPKIPLPEHLQIRPVTPVETYIKIHPSPPVPQTTQGFIGWRSTVPGLGLERYSKIISTKGAFYKDVQWPNEPTD